MHCLGWVAVSSGWLRRYRARALVAGYLLFLKDSSILIPSHAGLRPTFSSQSEASVQADSYSVPPYR